MNEVAKCGYSKGDSVRFYIIDQNKVSEFKDMIKQFVAGHELFGVYVFFIDSRILDLQPNEVEVDLKKAVNQIKTSLYHDPKENSVDLSKDVLDLMVVEKTDLIYKYSKEGKLEILDNDNTKKIISTLLKGIASKIINDPKWLIYPSGKEHIYSNNIIGENAINKIYTIMN